MNVYYSYHDYLTVRYRGDRRGFVLYLPHPDKEYISGEMLDTYNERSRYNITLNDEDAVRQAYRKIMFWNFQ